MDIINQLSSKQGDKTEKSNHLAAGQCIEKPGLLNDIVKGLGDNTDKKLQSDCMEVLTMVAEKNADIIVPFADKVIPLLAVKETKTRWEAAHTLSYIAEKIPDIIFTILPELQELIEKDTSTIVRDYTLDTVANYAKTGKEASDRSFKILKAALDLWDEKHAKQVFKGFNAVMDHQPSCRKAVAAMVKPYLDAKKKVVANEAGKILKRIEK